MQINKTKLTSKHDKTRCANWKNKNETTQKQKSKIMKQIENWSPGSPKSRKIEPGGTPKNQQKNEVDKKRASL